MAFYREFGNKVFKVEPIWECSGCGKDIIGQPYVNQNSLSNTDEHFCDEICEKAFHKENGNQSPTDWAEQ